MLNLQRSSTGSVMSSPREGGRSNPTRLPSWRSFTESEHPSPSSSAGMNGGPGGRRAHPTGPAPSMRSTIRTDLSRAKTQGIGDVLLVGLTGGIGAGKSTVARMLAERGAVVIDADELARRGIDTGTPGFDAIVKAFGPEAITSDGEIDRNRLAAL